MKIRKIEKLLLLEQTGELSSRQRRALNACPVAQAKRDELKAFCASVPAIDIEPSPWAVTKIAARLREERRSVVSFSKVWKPVFLTAACLTLVVSTFDFNQTSPAPVAVAVAEVGVWSAQFEEDLVELENLILAISDSSLDIMEM